MAETATPEVLWAQRSSSAEAAKNFVYLTISVPDVPASDLKLDLQPATLTFTGTSGTLKRKYHLDLEFFAEVDPEASKINHTSKNIEIKLQKKELNEEFWPRLLKGKERLHYLKTDFDKWVDEDEQNEAPEEDFSQFGGMGQGGPGGAGGMPGMGGDFGGIDFSKLGGGEGGMPDLSALAGAGGMGGIPGMGGEDDDEDDDDDEDEMPALEGDDKDGKAPAAAAAPAKKD